MDAIQKIEVERENFEAQFPVPRDCIWCGNGYSATEYNAWDAHKHHDRWIGWFKRAELSAQTIASKEAELVRVRDALAWSEQLNRRPGEGHNECFERIAEVFYRQTGHMRPGKDASPESGVSMDERQAAWDAWIAEGIAKMRAALKQPTE